MPKSIDVKRAEAADRRAANMEQHLFFAERAKNAGNATRAAYYTRKAERAAADVSNTRAKLRSRPANFVPWYERNDPISPGPQ